MKDFKLSNKKKTWVIFEDGSTSMEIGGATLRVIGKKVKREIDVSDLSDDEALDLLHNVRKRSVTKKGKNIQIKHKRATTKHK